MRLITTTQNPDADTLARWWVQLNCWVWPDDLPGKPDPPHGLRPNELRMAIRGAHAVVDLFADEALVDALWQNRARRMKLCRPDG